MFPRAGGIGLAATAAALLTPQLAGTAIVGCAGIFGLCWGLYVIALQDLVAKTFARRRRGALLAQRIASGGMMTLAVTAAIYVFAPQVARDYGVLLWIAFGMG